MPKIWEEDYVPGQKKRTDTFGFGEIGGIGQLVYHLFTFQEYQLDHGVNGEPLAVPIINKSDSYCLPTEDSLSGADLLVSLCNLARELDDPAQTRPYAEMIIDWCNTNAHPYFLDEIYRKINDSTFNVNQDAFLMEKDGTFSINQFMTDLERLYNTVSFYLTIEALKKNDNRPAFNLYREGRYFTGYPFFEKYKVGIYDEDASIDVSAAEGDLIKEMQIENQYIEEHPGEIVVVGEDDFEIFPQAHISELQEQLLDCFPDYTLRLRVSPGKNRVVYTADIHSVFDIAWYSFARFLAEEPVREIEKEHGVSRDPNETIVNCRHCGKIIIRRNSRQEYCDSPECQKARNANNQREFRRRKAIERVQQKAREK